MFQKLFCLGFVYQLLFLPTTQAEGTQKLQKVTLSVEKLKEVDERAFEIHDEGMFVVGAWSLATGAYSYFRWKDLPPGEESCLYKMSFFYTAVNLGIVGIGFWANSKRPNTLSLGSVSENISFSRVFMLG